MSEVISFRLDKNNPREAQALKILDDWESKGYAIRYVITEALYWLNKSNQETLSDNNIFELSLFLNQMKKLLEQLPDGEYPLISKQEENSFHPVLAEKFISSIRQAVKPGIKPD